MIAKQRKPFIKPTYYRPISILQRISKIFERLLLHKIIDNIIADHQFGFREKFITIQNCKKN